MAATGRNFSIIHEKIMPCRLVCMCPTMDLVASLHADGQLSVHRTMGWQRSFTLTLEDTGNRTLSCLTWSPNGKTLAVGYTDGAIQLFGVETGAEEGSLAFHEGRPLAALTWVAQQSRQGAARSRADEEADQLAEVAAAYADRCEHVLGSSDRMPGANGAAGAGLGSRSSEYGSQADDGFALLQGMKERPVSVLASADAAGVVVLSICGAYRLITIDLRSHRAVDEKEKRRGSVGSSRSSPPKVDSPRQRRSRRSPGQDGVGGAGLTESDGDGDGDGAEQGVRPLQLTLSSDLSLLSALIEVDGHIELVQVDLPLLWRQRHELKPLAMQFTAFRAVIGRLATYVPRMPQLWTSALQVLETKLGNLEQLLPRFGYDKRITPKDELIHLVTCGYGSDALVQFLSTGLTQAQLARMRKGVDTGTGQVEAMLQGDVSFLARTLLFRACDLHRLVVACSAEGGAESNGQLGLAPVPVEALLKDCEMLCVKVEQTLREVQISRSRLRFLLLWLEQVAPMVTDPNASEGAEDGERHPPSLTLANSVLSILKEPLPSDASPSNSGPHDTSPKSRVESMIGTDIPGLSTRDKPEKASGLPPEEAPLASRTIRDQVQRLETSVAEVFKAPTNSLTSAVANISRAKLCVSSEGGATEVVRTRAAAKAAAKAAARGAPPLVTMRTCMCFEDNLPAGCMDGSEPVCGNTGGIVVAAVAPDISRGGKGLDVVWIIVMPASIPTWMSSNSSSCSSDSGSKNSVRVVGVRSPPGSQVRQVAFYGSVPGVPTQNERRLALGVLLEPIGDHDQATATAFHLLALDDLSFTAVGSFDSFIDQGLTSPARKARGGGGMRDVMATARAQGIEVQLLSDLSNRSRELPEHIKGVTMALSGARGVACAVSSSKHLVVFDLEEDEEEDGEEEASEGE